MRNLYLLDCTLRDGGYVNDWEYGAGSIKSIFSRLDSAGVDAIEVGFLDERRQYDPNRSIFPDTKSEQLLGVFVVAVHHDVDVVFHGIGARALMKNRLDVLTQGVQTFEEVVFVSIVDETQTD